MHLIQKMAVVVALGVSAGLLSYSPGFHSRYHTKVFFLHQVISSSAPLKRRTYLSLFLFLSLVFLHNLLNKHLHCLWVLWQVADVLFFLS